MSASHTSTVLVLVPEKIKYDFSTIRVPYAGPYSVQYSLGRRAGCLLIHKCFVLRCASRDLAWIFCLSRFRDLP